MGQGLGGTPFPQCFSHRRLYGPPSGAGGHHSEGLREHQAPQVLWGQSKPSALKASEKALLQAEGPGRILRAVSFAADLCKTKEQEHQGLAFHLDNANPADDNAAQALIGIAAVSLPAIHMLQSMMSCSKRPAGMRLKVRTPVRHA